MGRLYVPRSYKRPRFTLFVLPVELGTVQEERTQVTPPLALISQIYWWWHTKLRQQLEAIGFKCRSEIRTILSRRRNGRRVGKVPKKQPDREHPSRHG